MLFLFVCVERATEKASHTWHSRVSRQPPPHRSLLRVTHFPLARRVLSFPRGPSRNLKTLWFTHTSYLGLQSSEVGGTWTVIPAENNTSFSPVKPSVRPHHREQALRIRDIISLPGKVVHSIFPPTTSHCSKVLQQKKSEK